MTNRFRAWVYHWRPALIVAAVFLVLAVAGGIFAQQRSHAAADQDRRDAAVSACMLRSIQNPTPGKTAADVIVECSLRYGG